MIGVFDESDAARILQKAKAKGRLVESKDDSRFKKVESLDYAKRAERRHIRSIANDCAPLPDIKNPERREETVTSLRLFAEHYFPLKFYLGWAENQLALIESMEQSVLHGGGLNAFALPRGSGKTSLAETCALWALFHAHKRYILCLGSTADRGTGLFQSIKTEIESNELLLEDFPEICHPFHFAEHNPIKFRYQHYRGKPTNIVYAAKSLSLPEVDESKAAGSFITCGSIGASFRGMKRTTGSGDNFRPDFVIIDDPQTDKTARSKASTEARERIIQGAILGLAGPKRPITVIMPCTVIEQNDLADRFLDRQNKPEWRGVRSKLLPTFPTNMDLWTEYQEIKNESYRNEGNGAEATAFYAANREKMDEGATVTWTERFNPPKEISAIQHAMNLYFQDPVAFASEYQNEPLIRSSGEQRPSIELTSKDILQRLSKLPYGVAPRSTVCITSGIDVQKDALYFITVAWQEDFGGVIVDYGTCPDQPREYYEASHMPKKLSHEFPGLLQSPLCYRGLEWLRDGYLAKTFKRDEANDDIPIDSVFIDANWNLTTDAVFDFCKKNASKFYPCHGKGIGAAMLPMNQWSRKAGEIPHKSGTWRIRPATLGANRGRHIAYDTNFWKSRVGERLVTPKGSANGLYLYGSSSMRHQLLADHLSSEIPIRTHGRGRDCDEWRTRANTSENHYWDCLVLAAVAASKSGLELLEITNTMNPVAGEGEASTQAAPLPNAVRRIAAPAPARKLV